MNDTLLMVLIALMALTLLILSWAVIALLVQARRELPVLRQRVDELNGRLARVLEETVPVLQTTHRTLEEVAETMENLHIVSDNIRHKLEVADEVAGKMRRVPEKAARALGRLMHYAFKLGGQLILQRLQGGRDRKPLGGRIANSAWRLEGEPPGEPKPTLQTDEGATSESSVPTGAETASLTEANQPPKEGGMIDEPR